MGVEETSPDWAIRVEINAKGNIATVTAYQKKLLKPSTSINQEGEEGEDDIHSKNKYNQTLMVDNKGSDFSPFMPLNSYNKMTGI